MEQKIKDLYTSGLITSCRMQYLLLCLKVQRSGLKRKEAMLKFNIAHSTYYRMMTQKLV